MLREGERSRRSTLLECNHEGSTGCVAETDRPLPDEIEPREAPHAGRRRVVAGVESCGQSRWRPPLALRAEAASPPASPRLLPEAVTTTTTRTTTPSTGTLALGGLKEPSRRVRRAGGQAGVSPTVQATRRARRCIERALPKKASGMRHRRDGARLTGWRRLVVRRGTDSRRRAGH